MSVSIIVAMSRNHAIGLYNQIPWRIPEDMKYFKELTEGHSVIMGRKTYESIGHALKGRENFVVTRNLFYSPEQKDVTLCSSLQSAVWQASSLPKDVFVIGGEQIYKEALPLATKLYITFIKKYFYGDRWFPEVNLAEWKLIESKQLNSDRYDFDIVFLVYERVNLSVSNDLIKLSRVTV